MQKTSLNFMGFHCTLRDMAIMSDMAEHKPRWPSLHIRTADYRWRGCRVSHPSPIVPRAIVNASEEPEDPDWIVPRSIIDPDFATTPFGAKAMAAMPSAPQNLLSVAQWSFGPTGLPDLKVLAYGDFSYNGRYVWQNWLFCRSQYGLELAEQDCNLDLAATLKLNLTFGEVAKSDWELQELIDSHSEMLEACPEDTILHTH